ncbi:TRAP transporter small permease [Chelativorans sp. YIM 93263]|uniref:TRAP transporter small permease n=1 Tax=Chelativorans sp. YIM 93263 TaxID=2906648 RepID=UPI002378D752|nr:TRAP transporter small permease [Chelativorans sp. YIM 93263]
MRLLALSVRRIVDGLLVSALAIIAVVLCLQVVMRYVFHSALPWPEELSQFLLVGLTFLGSWSALEHGRHIGLNMWPARAPGSFCKTVRRLAFLAAAAFVAYVGVGGLELVESAWSRPSTAMRIPLGMIYLIVPVSCALMVVYFLAVAWRGSPINTSTSE